MSQVDVVDFNPKTDRLAVNQGMLAIALRTIKELGFDISESYIQKAEEAYRNFYDVKRKIAFGETGSIDTVAKSFHQGIEGTISFNSG